MKNAAECAKCLATLLKKLPAAPQPDLGTDEGGPPCPIAVLVMSFLMWECTTPKASTAWRNLTTGVVDFNDLRVCMPQEMLDFIGVRYPRGLDRCQRLRAVLRDIYRREHAVELNGLAREGKREVRRYLESLEGMVPYVASRVSLLCFDAHAIPVDDQLRSQLIAVGAADDSVEVHELASWLEHHIKAEDAVAAHCSLQGWIDRGGGEPRARSRIAASPRKKTKTAKKTTKRSLSGGSRS